MEATVDQRVASLQGELQQIEERIKHSEVLHRYVGPDGDIYHYDRTVPKVVTSAAMGAVAAVLLIALLRG